MLWRNPRRMPASVRFGRGGHRDLEDLLERVVRRRPADQRHRATLLGRHHPSRLVHRRRDVDHDCAPHEVGSRRRKADRGGAAERHADHGAGGRGETLDHLGDSERVLPRAVVAVAAPVGVPVARQVDRQRRTVQGDDDAVPGVRVLPAAVQEHELGLGRAPSDDAQRLPRFQRAARSLRHVPARPGDGHLGCVLGDKCELVVRLGVVEGRTRSRPRQAIFIRRVPPPRLAPGEHVPDQAPCEKDHQQPHPRRRVEVHPEEVDRLLVGVLEHEHQRQNGDDRADDHLRRRAIALFRPRRIVHHRQRLYSRVRIRSPRMELAPRGDDGAPGCLRAFRG